MSPTLALAVIGVTPNMHVMDQIAYTCAKQVSLWLASNGEKSY